MDLLCDAVLQDPARLAAVDRARRLLPGLPMPLDAIARLATRLLRAPMAAVTLVGAQDEYFAGSHALPESLAGSGQAPLDHSLCKFVVCTDHPLGSADLREEDDPRLREHPLVTAYGIRAFLGVPIRDTGGTLIGALTVLDPAVRGWTDDDLAALLAVAELLQAGAPATGWESELLHALLDSLSVGMAACDEDGQVTVVNRALREAVGLPLTDALTQEQHLAAASALAHLDGTPMRREDTPLMRARAGEPRVETELLLRAEGRPDRTFATHSRPITGQDGAGWGAVEVAHEVTADRRAARYRNCHQIVSRVLTAATTAAEAAPGLLEAVATTIDWPYAELWLVDEATDELRLAGQWSAPGSGLDRLADRTVVKGTGVTGRVWATMEPLWVPDATFDPDIRTVLSVPAHDGGTMLGVLTCCTGTAEHHADLLTLLLDGVAAQVAVFVALLRAADLARQLDRAKDDFIALVGHELRTPLTSISANTTMLGEEPGHLGEDELRMVRVIERNAAALCGTVDTLLDLATLDAGHVSLTLTDVDLAAVVAAATAALDLTPRLAGPAVVRGDADRLRQVVDDLLSNAVKYSGPGGEVQVRLDVTDGAAELTVDDDGIGIPADERDRSFDRFFRARNVRHQGTPGSGLGLSRVRAVVRLHGGTITLTERQPQGTRACVRIPAAP